MFDDVMIIMFLDIILYFRLCSGKKVENPNLLVFIPFAWNLVQVLCWDAIYKKKA